MTALDAAGSDLVVPGLEQYQWRVRAHLADQRGGTAAADGRRPA